MKHLFKRWEKTQHIMIIRERRITPELSPTFPSIFYLGVFKLLPKGEELPEKRAKQAQRLCEPERDTEKPAGPGVALPPGCPLFRALAQFMLVLKTPW